MKLSFMKHYLEEIKEISSYKTVSFDQLPMKLGILPVSLVSDAHLRPKEYFLRKCLHNSCLDIYLYAKIMKTVQLRKVVAN